MARPNKFDLEDDEEEREAEEQERAWRTQEARRARRNEIRRLAPDFCAISPEAITCAEFALQCVRDKHPDAEVSYPGRKWMPATEMVKVLGLESLL